MPKPQYTSIRKIPNLVLYKPLEVRITTSHVEPGNPASDLWFVAEHMLPSLTKGGGHSLYGDGPTKAAARESLVELIAGMYQDLSSCPLANMGPELVLQHQYLRSIMVPKPTEAPKVPS